MANRGEALMTYALQRQSQSDEGTFGVLLDESGTQLCCTAELPWCDNDPDTSCVPSGTYQVISHNSPAHPNVWEISAVPNRTGILIHNGNLPLEDSLGCVIVGTTQGFLETHMAVLNSMAALNNLRNTLPSTFQLAIIDPISPQ